MVSPKQVWALFREAASGWLDDRAASMGAALAYYTAFSIAPLLIIAIAIAGLIFGRDAAQDALIAQLQDLLGEAGGNAVDEMLRSASDFGTGIIATAIGIVALLVGATTAFVELQDDLDRVWKAQPRVGSGIVNLIRSRMLSFGMVLGVGFLLTVSLVLSAAIAAAGKYFLSGAEEVLTQALAFILSFLVITLLFAMVYKVLPNVHVAWADVWVGAAITSLLFSIGKFLIGLYIGKSSVASSFGAAGPFVVLMLWIYYSTQIFLLGAEFTHAFAQRHGSRQGVRSADSRPSQPPNPFSAPTATRPAGEDASNVPTVSIDAALQASAKPRRWWTLLGSASAAGLLTGFVAARAARNALSKL
jgi:membrane protein